MSKISGSYEKFNRGVSQQVPEDRLSGQHSEQVNFISDFIVGLTRRKGSIMQDEVVFEEYNEEFLEETLKDSESFKTFDFSSGGEQYALCYRTAEKVTNSVLPFAFCFNKTTKKFVETVYNTPDPLLDLLVSGGASAIVNMGDYVYIAGNDITTTYSQETPWSDSANKKLGAVWVKTGNYSKTYKVDLIVKNTVTNVVTTITGEYKTKPSAYPGVLDTSDILSSDPDYQKKVNDRNNDYNTAFTQYIGEAAEDIIPSNIANEIKTDLEANLVIATLDTYVTVTLSNSTIGIETSGDYVIDDIRTTDGGDETSIDGVGNQVSIESDLIAEHFPGKIVKVLSRKSNEEDAVYYLAVPKYSGSPSGVLCEVVWKETAGVITHIEDAFIFSAVVSNIMYFAGSASDLETLASIPSVPTFQPSTVGDNLSVKVPFFVGKKIDYLGSFQDRLIIGAESTLLFSRNQEYLNFFRAETKTILDNDPVEVFSLGSEDDTIVSSATFDRDIVFFGRRKQYVISGKQIFAPRTTSIAALSSHEDAIDSKPVSSGNFIFYTKQRDNICSLHQLQTGLVQDSPESYECSVQLSDYIQGVPIEHIALTTPNNILMRVTGDRQSLFVYTYLDSANGAERLTDSWSKWTWHEKLGWHVGMTFKKGDIFVFTIRNNGTDWYIASDAFSLDTVLTSKPIFDSMRPVNYILGEDNTGFITDVDTDDNLFIAFDDTVPEFLLGQKFEQHVDLIDQYPSKTDAMWVGYNHDAYVVPTNPYIKDKNNISIINGRLTIIKYTFAVANTGGVEITVTPSFTGTEKTVTSFSGKSISTYVLGLQQLFTGPVSAVVGRETKEFSYKLKSREWLPVTVKSVEFVGQLYYNSKRV